MATGTYHAERDAQSNQSIKPSSFSHVYYGGIYSLKAKGHMVQRMKDIGDGYTRMSCTHTRVCICCWTQEWANASHLSGTYVPGTCTMNYCINAYQVPGTEQRHHPRTIEQTMNKDVNSIRPESVSPVAPSYYYL